MEMEKDIIRNNTLFTFISQLLSTGISVISAPIYACLLSTGEYSIYGVYQSWYDILFIVLSLNVYSYATNTAMAKFQSERDDFICSAQVFVTIILSLSFFILCKPLVTFSGYSIKIICLMFGDMILMNSFYLWDSRERYEFKYKKVNYINVLVKILVFIISLISILYAKTGGYGRIYGICIAHMIICVPIFFVNLMKGGKVRLRYCKYIVLFCVPLIPHFLSAKILNSFDRIMIENMCGKDAAGLYSFSCNLSGFMLIVNDVVLKSLIPWTYESINANERDRIKPVATRLIVLIGGMNVMFSLAVPEVIEFITPVEYHESAYLIPILLSSVFFMFLYNLFANIEYFYGETKNIALASVFAAVINIVLNYLFIPRFGYIAAAYTTMIAYGLYAGAHYYNMLKVQNRQCNGYSFYNDKVIALISIIVSFVFLFVIQLYDTLIARYLILCLLAMAMCRYFRKDILYMFKKG